MIFPFTNFAVSGLFYSFFFLHKKALNAQTEISLEAASFCELLSCKWC